MSLMPFLSRFPDNDACWAHPELMRWPDGPVCPKCGSIDQATAQKSRPHYWQCRACRALFTVAMGTRTHLPIANSDVVHRALLGRRKKHGRFLGQAGRASRHRTENRMVPVPAHPPHDGGQGRAADRHRRGGRSTYLGEKKRGKGKIRKRGHDDDQPKGRSGSRKSMVIVATERGGRARAARGRTHSGRNIARFVLDNVNRAGTVLVSDELPAYRWIGRKFPAHLHVNHSAGEYVRHDRHAAATAHVNTAESFNSTLKRVWVGVFHWFPIKHSNHCLHEVAFRWSATRVEIGDQGLAPVPVDETRMLTVMVAYEST